MSARLHRSIQHPIREGLSWDERWMGPDQGLIWCWERGRQKRLEEPKLAAQADNGELVVLAWKGGVEKKLKMERKPGTLQYLATWQGLRGQDLDLSLEGPTSVVCSKTGQTVVFSSASPKDEEPSRSPLLTEDRNQTR